MFEAGCRIRLRVSYFTILNFFSPEKVIHAQKREALDGSCFTILRVKHFSYGKLQKNGLARRIVNHETSSRILVSTDLSYAKKFHSDEFGCYSPKFCPPSLSKIG